MFARYLKAITRIAPTGFFMFPAFATLPIGSQIAFSAASLIEGHTVALSLSQFLQTTLTIPPTQGFSRALTPERILKDPDNPDGYLVTVPVSLPVSWSPGAELQGSLRLHFASFSRLSFSHRGAGGGWVEPGSLGFYNVDSESDTPTQPQGARLGIAFTEGQDFPEISVPILGGPAIRIGHYVEPVPRQKWPEILGKSTLIQMVNAHFPEDSAPRTFLEALIKTYLSLKKGLADLERIPPQDLGKMMADDGSYQSLIDQIMADLRDIKSFIRELQGHFGSLADRPFDLPILRPILETVHRASQIQWGLLEKFIAEHRGTNGTLLH